MLVKAESEGIRNHIYPTAGQIDPVSPQHSGSEEERYSNMASYPQQPMTFDQPGYLQYNALHAYYGGTGPVPSFGAAQQFRDKLWHFKEFQQANDEEKAKKPDITEEQAPPTNQSAFLGPNIWNKTIPYENEEDFRLEYMDLDEFLVENGLSDKAKRSGNASLMQQLQRGGHGGHAIEMAQKHGSPPNDNPDAPRGLQKPTNGINKEMPQSQQEFMTSENDMVMSAIPGQDGFDPEKRTFTEDELRPQPILKKSKKIFVPENLKDDKYWCRRNKNNIAAKRSRDARRVKENQIAMRASYLERESEALRAENRKLKSKNKILEEKLAKYESMDSSKE